MPRRNVPRAEELFSLKMDPRFEESAARGTEPEHDDRSAPEPDDCAVVAAVVRQFWDYDGSWEHPPVLYLGEGDWPGCDWSCWGLSFHDGPPIPRTAPRSERRISYSFGKPAYDSGGALIETGVSFKGSGGYGGVCRVRQDTEGWYVDGARLTWLS